MTQKQALDEQIVQLAQEFELTADEKNAIIAEQQNVMLTISSLSDELKEEQRRIADEEANKERNKRKLKRWREKWFLKVSLKRGFR